ncbi:hypothetical protein PRUPE_4G277100 [Prunus persica]|uniref:Uncharacterized protein n=1 Tax=Prunus persica TaxID=3760 RepID=A0A251PS14_PRUPE|nr:hypothetical protein PRUPE_4G277100 [Prunus persica]
MGNFRNLAAASNTHSPYASLSHPPLSLNFIWVAEKMHICQLCILLAVIWLYRFCHEASTMMRDIPSLSFLCAGIYLVSSLHQSNYTWSSYKVRAYLQRQWKQILSGRVSLQDFVSAKEN